MHSYIQETKLQQHGLPGAVSLFGVIFFLPHLKTSQRARCRSHCWRTPILVYLVCSGPRLAASWDSEGFSPLLLSVSIFLHLSTELSGHFLCVLGLAFLCPKRPPPTEIMPKPVSWRQASASLPTWSKQASRCPGSLETRCPLGYPSDKTAPRPPVAASRER